MEKKASPSTQPCGTPNVIFTGLDHAVPRTTCYDRLVMYSIIVPSILKIWGVVKERLDSWREYHLLERDFVEGLSEIQKILFTGYSKYNFKFI